MMLFDMSRLQIHNSMNRLSGDNGQRPKVAILRDDDSLLLNGQVEQERISATAQQVFLHVKTSNWQSLRN